MSKRMKMSKIEATLLPVQEEKAFNKTDRIKN